MRAHLNTGPPEVMVCSFRISDLMGPDKPHGDPAATARWQLCPEAGGSVLVPGHPFRLKSRVPAGRWQRAVCHSTVKQAAVQGMAPAPSGN